jgi:hypothetical protein
MKNKTCEMCHKHTFTLNDEHIVETAPADYYPYEGEIITIICPVCGYMSTFKEDEIDF